MTGRSEGEERAGQRGRNGQIRGGGTGRSERNRQAREEQAGQREKKKKQKKIY